MYLQYGLYLKLEFFELHGGGSDMPLGLSMSTFEKQKPFHNAFVLKPFIHVHGVGGSFVKGWIMYNVSTVRFILKVRVF